MQQRSEETRTRILAEANRLFAQNGYDATGVAQICTAAGVSKGAFYHHFDSKHAVFMRLLNDWLGKLEAQLGSLAGDAGGVGALGQLGPLAREIFASGQGQLPMFLEFWLQAARDPAVWETTIAPYQHFHAIFTRFFEEGMRSGTLHTPNGMDSTSTARGFMGLAIGLIVQGLFDPASADWEAVTMDNLAVFMNGLARSAQ